MKNLVCFFAVAVLTSSTVFAAHPSNNVLGYENGVSLKLMGESGFGIQTIIGFGLFIPDNMDDNANDLDIDVSLNVFRCMWESEKANFNLFTGVQYMLDGSSVRKSDFQTDVAIKFGAEPEVFLSPRLSVSTKMGIKLLISGDRRGAEGKSESNTGSMKLSSFGDMFGSAALNWYFWSELSG